MTTALDLEREVLGEADGGEFVPRRMTIDEWNALDEDETGEFVDGWLVKEEVPNRIHEGVVTWLLLRLGVWAETHGAWVFASGTKLSLSRRRGRIPDLVVWLAGHPRPPSHGAVLAPPSVVVEVITPTKRDEARDRIAKFEEYAAFGVRFYWLVSPQLHTLEVYELEPDGRYARAASIVAGTLDPVPGCEGLTLDMDALWARCDEIERG